MGELVFSALKKSELKHLQITLKNLKEFGHRQIRFEEIAKSITWILESQQKNFVLNLTWQVAPRLERLTNFWNGQLEPIERLTISFFFNGQLEPIERLTILFFNGQLGGVRRNLLDRPWTVK